MTFPLILVRLVRFFSSIWHAILCFNLPSDIKEKAEKLYRMRSSLKRDHAFLSLPKFKPPMFSLRAGRYKLLCFKKPRSLNIEL